MRMPRLRTLLPHMTEEDIQESLETLFAEDRIVVERVPNNLVPGREVVTYLPKDSTAYPMKESIEVGGVEFPRLFHGDMVGAEDLNMFTEALAEYDSKVERRVEELASTLTRKYWANVAALFGLFVALFALILRATDPVRLPQSSKFADVFLLQVARLGPLALILFGFVFALWLVMRRL